PWGQLTTEEDPASVGVSLRTVDSLLAGARLDRVDLVKIDVEGADLEVLRGMERTLAAEPPPFLVVECCPHTLRMFGATPTDLVRFLEQRGYRAYTVEPNRLIRRRAEEVQVTTVTDVLAVRRDLPELPGWRVDPPLSIGENLRRFVAESQHDNADCRACCARAGRELDPALRGQPEVQWALARLKDDPDPRVHDAIAWWEGPRVAAGQTA
ncbi:MAG: FkbM family methyltransferase, partial [Candidatus Dormibacteraeota bacterium]|nr:FkbM family methyltransferase [Candidatus Dormibacteraeota bacterium]